MTYYDSDCFWTNEELGRKKVEEGLQNQGFFNQCKHWCKQMLIYVVDWEDAIVNEVNNPTSAQLPDHNNDYHHDQNSYRTKSSRQEES